jgi:hypothetical protein
MTEKARKRGRPPGDYYPEDAEALPRMHALIQKKHLSITAAATQVKAEMMLKGTNPVDRLRKKYPKYLKLLKKRAAEQRAAEQAAQDYRPAVPSLYRDAIEAARYASRPEIRRARADAFSPERMKALAEAQERNRQIDFDRLRKTAAWVEAQRKPE